MGMDVLKVLSANGLVALFGLVSSLVLPKILKLEDYAYYQAFLLYLSYVAVFHLGFPTGLSIKYAGGQVEKINRSQYKSEFILQILIPAFFSVIGICIYLYSANAMVLYISFLTVSYCFFGGFLSLLQSWGRFGLYAVLRVLTSGGLLLLPIIYFLIEGRLSADNCIQFYLLVYAIMMIWGLNYNASLIRNAESKKIFSNENFQTGKTGFIFLLGNYITLLLHSIDKQFIQWFCMVQEFAYYSFALTMQNTMTIFITAVSQPLFPYIASGKLQSREQYMRIKRLLMMLGSASGLAYFACVLVVKLWISNYEASLSVIHIYFAVFPAIAVINGLYLNLYKVQGRKYRYIADLLIVFIVAAIANFLAIKLEWGYLGVAFATVLVNYLWFFYGQILFKELSIEKKDVVFVVLFLLEFYFASGIQSPLWGIVEYFILDLLLCFFCFKKEILFLANKVVRKGEK